MLSRYWWWFPWYSFNSCQITKITNLYNIKDALCYIACYTIKVSCKEGVPMADSKSNKTQGKKTSTKGKPCSIRCIKVYPNKWIKHVWTNDKKLLFFFIANYFFWHFYNMEKKKNRWLYFSDFDFFCITMEMLYTHKFI